MRTYRRPDRAPGFTLIELVVVMAMLGLLLSIALPQFMASLQRGREQALQYNLATMRNAIDKFYGDRGRYPDQLDDLVTQGYLRAIPSDPYTESPTWLVVEPRDRDKGGVIDVRSTLQDSNGAPRQPPVAQDGAQDHLPNLVDGNGGASRTVVAGPAASAAAESPP